MIDLQTDSRRRLARPKSDSTALVVGWCVSAVLGLVLLAFLASLSLPSSDQLRWTAPFRYPKWASLTLIGAPVIYPLVAVGVTWLLMSCRVTCAFARLQLWTVTAAFYCAVACAFLDVSTALFSWLVLTMISALLWGGIAAASSLELAAVPLLCFLFGGIGVYWGAWLSVPEKVSDGGLAVLASRLASAATIGAIGGALLGLASLVLKRALRLEDEDEES